MLGKSCTAQRNDSKVIDAATTHVPPRGLDGLDRPV